MEVFLVILVISLIAGGIIFSVVPPLPGPLLSYGGMIAAHFISEETAFSTNAFIIWGILTAAVVVVDQVLPVATTKKFGGTKSAVIGGTIGTLVGFFAPIPFGVIIGPLVGAIIGDLYGGHHIRSAFKSGLGSFIGFILATLVKTVFSLLLGGVVVWKVGAFTVTEISKLF